jgi:hypothetical protein
MAVFKQDIRANVKLGRFKRTIRFSLIDKAFPAKGLHFRIKGDLAKNLWLKEFPQRRIRFVHVSCEHSGEVDAANFPICPPGYNCQRLDGNDGLDSWEGHMEAFQLFLGLVTPKPVTDFET